MNVLQICDNNQEQTTIASIVNYIDRYKVITKYDFKNISYISYDAFIITIDVLANINDIDKTLEPIYKQSKPIIFVYHANNKPDDVGMKYLTRKYELSFKQMDCSVIETNNWNYKPDADDDFAYSIFTKKGTTVCGIKNTNQYYIFKQNNIVIMHETANRWYQGHPDTSRTANMLNFLFNVNQEYEKSSEVEWIDRISILDDKSLNKRKSMNQNKIVKLENDNKLIMNKINDNNYFKKLLYTTGDELSFVVRDVLAEILNIKVDDIDKKKQDLYFVLDGKNILVEVKGVNRPYQRDDISQTMRHVNDYASNNNIYGKDIFEKCKGVLIINPYNLNDLDNKITKEIYSPEVKQDAEYYNICTIDTITLLNLYSNWKNNSKGINLKDIILNSTYNQPNFMDIIIGKSEELGS